MPVYFCFPCIAFVEPSWPGVDCCDFVRTGRFEEFSVRRTADIMMDERKCIVCNIHWVIVAFASRSEKYTKRLLILVWRDPNVWLWMMDTEGLEISLIESIHKTRQCKRRKWNENYSVRRKKKASSIKLKHRSVQVLMFEQWNNTQISLLPFEIIESVWLGCRNGCHRN